MHRGHLDAIMRAKKENDKCFVIVCGYDNEERAGNINMTLKERTAIVRKIFANDEIINILSINDTQLGIDESMCDNNWIIWQEKVKELVGFDKYDLYTKYTWYVAEPYYKEMLEKHNLLNARTTLIDKVVPVSGTYIRQNPIKYWKYIVREYRNNLCHNILITGTASEGKTTLVRDISTYFGIQHSEEFGRDDLLNKGKVDTDLTADDFVDFLVGQSLDMRKRVFNNDNGVFISDTDMSPLTIISPLCRLSTPSPMMSVAANSFLQSVVSYPNSLYGHSGRNISAEQFLSACMVLTLTLSGVSGMTNILAVPLLISLLRSALIYISHSPWQFKHSAFESILTPIFSALIVVSDFLDLYISFAKSYQEHSPSFVTW